MSLSKSFLLLLSVSASIATLAAADPPALAIPDTKRIDSREESLKKAFKALRFRDSKNQVLETIKNSPSDYGALSQLSDPGTISTDGVSIAGHKFRNVELQFHEDQLYSITFFALNIPDGEAMEAYEDLSIIMQSRFAAFAPPTVREIAKSVGTFWTSKSCHAHIAVMDSDSSPFEKSVMLTLRDNELFEQVRDKEKKEERRKKEETGQTLQQGIEDF